MPETFNVLIDAAWNSRKISKRFCHDIEHAATDTALCPGYRIDALLAVDRRAKDRDDIWDEILIRLVTGHLLWNLAPYGIVTDEKANRLITALDIDNPETPQRRKHLATRLVDSINSQSRRIDARMAQLTVLTASAPPSSCPNQ